VEAKSLKLRAKGLPGYHPSGQQPRQPDGGSEDQIKELLSRHVTKRKQSLKQLQIETLEGLKVALYHCMVKLALYSKPVKSVDQGTRCKLQKIISYPSLNPRIHVLAIKIILSSVIHLLHMYLVHKVIERLTLYCITFPLHAPPLSGYGPTYISSLCWCVQIKTLFQRPVDLLDYKFLYREALLSWTIPNKLER
jgi:hypothetical protein